MVQAAYRKYEGKKIENKFIKNIIFIKSWIPDSTLCFWNDVTFEHRALNLIASEFLLEKPSTSPQNLA
jgi:hypothetical protein